MDRRDRLLRALLDGRCDVVLLYRPQGGALPSLGDELQPALDRLAIDVLDHDALLVVTAPANRSGGGGDWLVTQRGCVHREAFDRHIAPQIEELTVREEVDRFLRDASAAARRYRRSPAPAERRAPDWRGAPT